MSKGNSTFFRGDRQSSWPLVAYGMIGASVSGVSFVSVPGMTMFHDMTYLQTCMGFIFGYIIVAYTLLPLYYKHNLTSIYELLDRGSGGKAGQHRKIASAFFILSDMLGAAVKFFLVCTILQQLLFDDLGVPFLLTVPLLIGIIWLYSHKSGIKTLVYTDVLQTTCMLTALVLIIINVCTVLGLSLPEAIGAACRNEHGRIFEFDDFVSTRNFWKQFISGIFIVIVMTGLNQNMMQKNLTCKNLRDAQKNMSICGFFFLPVNFLFLVLGVLLILLSEQQGLPLPESGDQLLPSFITKVQFGHSTLVLFTIGIVTAAFSSADSSLTALTTSVCVDLFEDSENVRRRKFVHIAVCVVFILLVYLLQYSGSKSLIDLVYILVGYTYGPLLGLFLYTLTHAKKKGTCSMAGEIMVCTASPVLSYLLNLWTTAQYSYHFGYELLLINGFITYLGLCMLRRK